MFKFMKLMSLVIVCSSMMALLPKEADADVLTYFLRDGNQTDPTGFYNFDTTTGLSSLRAPVTFGSGLFSMDVRQSDQAVFGVDLAGELLRINPDTGGVTVVGNSGIGQLLAIAIRPSDGTLFVDSGNSLYSVNATTAVATLIGATRNVDRGLAFSPTGTLYGFNSSSGALYTVNPANGQTTLVGNSGAPISSLAEDATFAPGNTLYMQDFGGDIFQVDPTSGTRTIVGHSVLTDVLGLFGPASVVPEPSSLVLCGIAAGMVLAVGRFRRK